MFKGLLAATAVATILAISPVASSNAQAQGMDRMDGMHRREMTMHRMDRMRMHRMMERRMMERRMMRRRMMHRDM